MRTRLRRSDSIPLTAASVHTNGDRSLWLADALADEQQVDRPRLEGERDCDVCIIGGGFTGMWTALELKRRAPESRVILLEADICGAGASGRNGGFALTWWAHFRSLMKLVGPTDAVRLAHRADDSIEQIGQFCRNHGLEETFQRSGWVWAATNPKQVGAWQETVNVLAGLGEAPFQQLSPRELAAVTGSPTHLAGVYEPGAATVHPAKLARALASAIADAGVEIHEHTQATAIEPGTPATVSVGTATVRAEQVILAAGAWAARIPEIGAGLVVVASDVIATEPIPEQLTEIGISRGVCVSDCRRLVHYYRPTVDGRMVFGKGGGTLAHNNRITATFDHPGARVKWLRGHLIRTYPTLWDVRIADAWSGPVDYSLSSLPFFVRLRQASNVVVCTGFSGDGVGPSQMAGEFLAEMVHGSSDAALPMGLRTVPHAAFPMPPEPIRYVGGKLVRAAIARRERAEDMAVAPDRLTTLVASLDPTGFTDRGTQGRNGLT